jgi:uncharacterized protein
MGLSEKELKNFITYAHELLGHEQVHEMKQYIQHGNTSTFTHCVVVAYYSYLISLRLPLRLDTKSIVRGALLHDFYLYDWHIPDKSHRLHGFVHPDFALTNAKKHFILNPIEEDIIAKHMWPLTLRRPPLYKESFLVSIVDKFCSLAETFYITLIPKEYKRINRMLITSKL